MFSQDFFYSRCKYLALVITSRIGKKKYQPFINEANCAKYNRIRGEMRREHHYSISRELNRTLMDNTVFNKQSKPIETEFNSSRCLSKISLNH
ncbi:hypothetical protein FGO68_gene14166 [Halteria grandinella]|uniref:Uncharacterized protein n=1 Tax=Halteria grandinella TaxID=5974 RepID=A0A8J8NCU5_HALGN|nr:hypothetical protein FGO68_gene14166 [Halteria grandinella]